MKHLSDILILAGASAVVYGAWLLQPEVALIVGGALVLALGLAGARIEAIARRSGK